MEKKKLIIISGVLAAVTILGVAVLFFWLKSGDKDSGTKTSEKDPTLPNESNDITKKQESQNKSNDVGTKKTETQNKSNDVGTKKTESQNKSNDVGTKKNRITK
ncbi:hypothetical protein M153_650004390 [Pseudoloma neurophilia]|uniref:Uncharacterized protein n=1 Tax=Pseudoloma neurophilia TaxID=146866 RepID=A0A0R0M612_9MICR|nr:hypothetical protein M153_650004390 [Pseudoloma neurophilia]